MNINIIIKEKRKELSLTQEQLANQLGVSTPAVSKWESGSSYPDITILPNLAKILKTDINTLLSFKSDLSDEEIEKIIKDLYDFSFAHSLDETLGKAYEIISEYPNCHKLILNIALTLDGLAIFKLGCLDNGESLLEETSSKIEKLYLKVIESSDINVKGIARQQLIFKEIGRKNFDKAESLLENIPDKIMIDKSDVRTRLEFSKGNLDEAKKAAQEKLYKLNSDVVSLLLLILDIELEQKNIETAEYISDAIVEFCHSLDLWEYTANLGKLQFYIKTKNEDGFIESLSALINAYEDIFEINKSPLYSNISAAKSNEDKSRFNSLIDSYKTTLVKSLEYDDEFDFVKDNPKFKEIVDKAIKK